MWQDVEEIDAYIGLGSNLNKPSSQLHTALQALAKLPHTQLISQSDFYQSPALVGEGVPAPQPDYINAVAHLKTQLTPLDLLHALQAIEQQQGRQRLAKTRWAARTLDLDLLLYGQTCLDTPELRLPHPEISRRAFVLVPLHDCDAHLSLPTGERIADLCLQCVQSDLVKIQRET